MASQHIGAVPCSRPRITELPNELTSNIDACNALGIVRTLRQSDAQLFAGWGVHSSVNDTDMLRKLDRLADRTSQLLRENKEGANNVVVFTGCGTSGRIAWMCSRSFNNILSSLGERPCFSYLIAGGDKALIVGDELPEDDPPRGAEDLRLLTKETDTVMLVGITCGLSAPYVAGQIDLAIQQPNYIPVLVGFNPIELARDNKIEKWHKTCKEVFLELERLGQNSDGAFVLNPIVGPEPITGSSRMKGGSMTAVLLEIIFTTALSRALSIPLSKLITGVDSITGQPSTVAQDCTSNGERVPEEYSLTTGQSEIVTLVDVFTDTYNAAYRPSDGLAHIVSVAGDSLRHPEGHLYYLGSQLFGIMGFIDSSEMVSTYGSSPHEVRGFVVGGWNTCKNVDGDLSGRGQLYQISTADFERNILPKLTEQDTVLWVESTRSKNQEELGSLLDKVHGTHAKCCRLVLSRTGEQPINSNPDKFVCSVHIQLSYFSVLQSEDIFAGFALKLILNAISTGANVLKGRVFGNRMINLTVANDKLFYRSISIITELASVSEEKARLALLRAIYKEDSIEKYLPQPVSSHIRAATKTNMVVPLGILLAAKGCTVEEACGTLNADSNLRAIIEQCKS